MRPRFRETLAHYSNLSKKEEATIDPQKKKKLGYVVDFAIEEAARKAHTEEETQREIYDIQKVKQRLMRHMHRELAKLDSDEEHEMRGNGIRVYAENDEYFFIGPNGTETLITLGEIMTDGEWGREYALDPKSVPKRIRKQYIVERTKRNLSRALDKQIALEEQENAQLDDKKRDTYRRILEETRYGVERTGLIAEKMVQNFLRKLTYDLGFDFEILSADVFQDVEQKVDFVIKRKRKTRGVKVQPEASALAVGVQFTTQVNPEVLKSKRAQIRRVKDRLPFTDEETYEESEEDEVADIILVSIPLHDLRKIFLDWQRAGAPSGGPDKLWDLSTKHQIFKSTLRGIFTPAEIDERWKKVAEQHESHEKKKGWGK